VPTYQYACTDCGDRSEVVQRFTDDPRTVCIACGGKLRKIFSPVGIVFKGSGFYRNDSRNGSSTVSAGKDSAGKDSAGKDSSSAGANGTSAAGSESKKASSSESSSSSSSSSAGSASGGDKKSSSVSTTSSG
jgi:putative FmdB family regulatory protein